MRISIRVKPNSKEEFVEKTGEGEFTVRVKAPAREGRANEAVVRLLSGYFGVPGSRITIKLGASGKNKVVDIL